MKWVTINNVKCGKATVWTAIKAQLLPIKAGAFQLK
jgi:hypothetical protein